MTAVITTIQPPTRAVAGLVRRLAAADWPLVVIGDRKGPERFDVPGAVFLDLDAQERTGFGLVPALEVDHYARKNIGYLVAIRDGAQVIYETDDDNEPLPSWHLRERNVTAHRASPTTWFNPYRVFTTSHIWPRGFPLNRVSDPATWTLSADEGPGEADCPIQQGLANGSPDVDAIWRLTQDREITFEDAPSVVLPPGTWCPFNSQSTWWWPEAFTLLYLPSHCSFRMTDIWRSFIAQRCLWERGLGIAFHTAEVHQDRNQHDLMRDFRDEVPGYVGNEEIVEILGSTALDPSPTAVADNLGRCYDVLIEAGFFPEEERRLVSLWVADLRCLGTA